MSSTNRGKQRVVNDQYATPAWCVEALFKSSIQLPSGLWLEPCAGMGNIVNTITRTDVQFVVCELDDHYNDFLYCLAKPVEGVYCPQDFLTMDFGTTRFDVTITNPPYNLSFEFVQKAMSVSDHVVMLMRLNWLGSIERSEFLRTCTPDVYILPVRPSFIDGQHDSCEYSWFHFYKGAAGKIEILPIVTDTKKTPREFETYGYERVVR